MRGGHARATAIGLCIWTSVNGMSAHLSEIEATFPRSISDLLLEGKPKIVQNFPKYIL